MQSGIYLPSLTRLNKILIAVMAVSFLLTSILSQLGASLFFLGLSPQSFFSGHFYQLATYPLISQGPIEVLFNCLLLWFVGADLERLWGAKRYLSFLGFSALGGGAIFLVISTIFGVGHLTLTGAAGMTSALLVAFAIINPEQVFSFMLIFPMKAKYFCGLLIALQLYMGIFSPAGVLAWGQLGSIFSGFVLLLYWTKVARGRRKRPQTHLRVVSSNDENPPKYWH